MLTEISIKQLRELMGLRQDYLAKKLSMSQPAYSKLENGLTKTKEANYLMLAELLHVKLDYVKANRIPVFFYVDDLEVLVKDADESTEYTKFILKNMIEQRDFLLKNIKKKSS